MNGHYSMDNTTYGSDALAQCVRGYWFSDRAFYHSITCQSDGAWSALMYPCVGKEFITVGEDNVALYAFSSVWTPINED